MPEFKEVQDEYFRLFEVGKKILVGGFVMRIKKIRKRDVVIALDQIDLEYFKKNVNIEKQEDTE